MNVDCISDFHFNHPVASVIKRAEDINEGWKKGVEEISNDIINNQLKEVNIQSEKLLNDIEKVSEEIKRLEDTLANLIDKKEYEIFLRKKISSLFTLLYFLHHYHHHYYHNQS